MARNSARLRALPARLGSSARMVVPERRVGQVDVGRHVGRGSESLVGELGQKPCGGPGPVSRHRHQDRTKRVVTHQFLDLSGDVGALGA